jgi:hypothetical protein
VACLLEEVVVSYECNVLLGIKVQDVSVTLHNERICTVACSIMLMLSDLISNK